MKAVGKWMLWGALSLALLYLGYTVWDDRYEICRETGRGPIICAMAATR